ncbi:MAG: CYTH domain-containing protein [Myxococcota bacterium]|jgi:CYTH domain-containing protein|nr:CYTH domain-containing protein [Myxococcota bacterium]
MGQEIERKFLLTGDGWRTQGRSEPYRQGYLSTAPGRTVRVRTVGERGYLTIKGPATGARRAEYEYPIPLADAQELLATLCEQPLIEKRRTRVEYAGLIWEIDEFFGENEGLIVAEVELTTEDQPIVRPPWIGAEVTGDHRYGNSHLGRHPYSRW